jgi:hypothetical protein
MIEGFSLAKRLGTRPQRPNIGRHKAFRKNWAGTMLL